MKNILILVAISVFLASCGKINKQNNLDDCKVVASLAVNGYDTLMVCDFAEITDTIFFPLSGLVEEIELIPLDTCQEVLFRPDWSECNVSENYIAVAEMEKPIKLFDRKTGKYLNQIGNRGQGPGEYFNASPLLIDEDADAFYTKSSGGLLRFKLSGEFVAKYPLAYTLLTNLIHVNTDREEITVIGAMSNAFTDSTAVYIQSFDGNLKQRLTGKELGVSRIPEPTGYVADQENSFYVFHRESTSDSLYHYDVAKNRLQAKFTVKWKNGIPAHIFTELPGYYCCIYTSGRTFADSDVVMIDKKTGKGAFVKLVIDQWGDVLWTDFFRNTKLTGADGFALLVDPLNLAEKVDLSEITGKTVDESQLQNENSWVLIGKWKKK